MSVFEVFPYTALFWPVFRIALTALGQGIGQAALCPNRRCVRSAD